MLNKNGQRELAYVTTITEVVPLDGYDRVEYARIGAGWWVVVKKDQFKPGDLCVYIETDSLVPTTEQFAFLEKYNYKVKRIRLCHVPSEGLIMSLADLGLTDVKEGDFLTQRLGITYYVPGDNERKANINKYASMQDRYKKFFRIKLVKKLMKYTWFRELCYFFIGKNTKKHDWPDWCVRTDEERCQNMPQLFMEPLKSQKWYITEKIDGTSTTFTYRKYPHKKPLFLVCSRNVVFSKTKQNCWYDVNYYTKMAEKYNMEKICQVLYDILVEDSSIDFVTVQGETYGPGIQKRDYSSTEVKFAVFNIIYGKANEWSKRLNPEQMSAILNLVKERMVNYPNLTTVPILGTLPNLPDSCEQLLEFANGNSVIDGLIREGLVFRSVDGVDSFKAVSPEYLDSKYHQN